MGEWSEMKFVFPFFSPNLGWGNREIGGKMGEWVEMKKGGKMGVGWRCSKQICVLFLPVTHIKKKLAGPILLNFFIKIIIIISNNNSDLTRFICSVIHAFIPHT